MWIDDGPLTYRTVYDNRSIKPVSAASHLNTLGLIPSEDAGRIAITPTLVADNSVRLHNIRSPRASLIYLPSRVGTCWYVNQLIPAPVVGTFYVLGIDSVCKNLHLIILEGNVRGSVSRAGAVVNPDSASVDVEGVGARDSDTVNPANVRVVEAENIACDVVYLGVLNR